MAKVKVTIKQLKNTRDSDYGFMDYDWAVKHGFNLNDYNVVYDGEVEIDNESLDNIDVVLEQFFLIFNIKRPEGYNGHSLSVSDIVEYNGVNYYVDNLGFVEVK